MAHLALYRKWRPATFEDVVEQQHIVDTLKNSIMRNSVSHAYLFCGTRGTGKTTLAKIFARAVNCLDPRNGSPCNVCDVCKGILDGSLLDVQEIDAASNNGVDDVREIKDAVMYLPALAKYKVYIIDEVHMLSTGAFNALLKTLEEPPSHVVFILATTEPHKLPATILSRCQRFDFRRISVGGLTSRLLEITQSTGIAVDHSALTLIARISQGGMRDAISLLDQCLATGKTSISRDDVIAVSGMAATGLIDKLAMALVEKDVQTALSSIHDALYEGQDLLQLCSQLVEWFRNLMILKTGGDALKLLELDDGAIDVLNRASGSMSQQEVISYVKELSETEGRLKWAENQRIFMEVSVVRICTGSQTGNVLPDPNQQSMLESRISQLERKLQSILTGDIKLSSVSETKPKSSETAVPAPEKPSGRNTSADAGSPKASSISAEKGRELKEWTRIIDYVRDSGKMKVYAYLLDTKCVMLDDTRAVIVVGSEDGLKKNILSKNDSLEIISEALQKKLGLNVELKVKDERELGIFTPSAASDDPVLEKVKKLANDFNIPLNIGE